MLLIQLICLMIIAHHRVSSYEVRSWITGHGRPQSVLYSSQYTELEQLQIANKLSGMKTIDLKNMLKQSSISTSGLFDKSDYITTILSREQQLMSQCHYEKLNKLANLNNDRRYCGVECMVGNHKLSFILDTGSSVSLIKRDIAVNKLSLSLQSQVLYSDSLGHTTTTLTVRHIHMFNCLDIHYNWLLPHFSCDSCFL